MNKQNKWKKCIGQDNECGKYLLLTKKFDKCFACSELEDFQECKSK